jgi:hypothetical protein
MSHDIFISYSRKDISDVKAIKEELEKHDFSCWMDLTGIVSGTRRFSKTIIDAIEASRTMLFFLSSNSQQSEWALKEIDYAMYEVAQCYEKGLGTERDRGKALLWYQRCVKSRYAASHDAEIRLAELAEE